MFRDKFDLPHSASIARLLAGVMEEAREEFCDLSPPVSCAVCRSLRQHTTNLKGTEQIPFFQIYIYLNEKLGQKQEDCLLSLKVRNVQLSSLPMLCANITHKPHFHVG